MWTKSNGLLAEIGFLQTVFSQWISFMGKKQVRPQILHLCLFYMDEEKEARHLISFAMMMVIKKAKSKKKFPELSWRHKTTGYWVHMATWKSLQSTSCSVVLSEPPFYFCLSHLKTFPEPSAGAQHPFGITSLEEQTRTILRLLKGPFEWDRKRQNFSSALNISV